ncbi:adenine deaminase [Hydrogenispora ethanolica]|nr:adenine deaminase C-terminal domain-containing protein [Hydrogenispora ethanolica]
MDLLIQGGQVFNSYRKRFGAADIVIDAGRIVFVGDAGPLGLEYRHTVAAAGKTIVPGLIDIHMHIESSMATPRAFAAAIIGHGVTTIVAEPHEMANVFGLAGVRAMLAAGKGAAVDIFCAAPSSVPSTAPEFETTGGTIGQTELAELLADERVICLGEVMNCYDIIHGTETKTQRLLEFFRKNRPGLPIEGHCAKVAGMGLAKVLAAGVGSDHTQQTVASLAEKIAAGMFIEIQEKSLTPEIVTYLVANQLYEHIALVTDDVMADKLVREGHLDRLIRKAVALGMPLEEALYCATYTPARRMNRNDRGSIAPGKIADLVILADRETFTIESVYKNGVAVYGAGDPIRTAVPEPPAPFPESFYRSIRRGPISAADLRIPAPSAAGTVSCRVIGVRDGTTATDEIIAAVGVRDGYLDWEHSPYCLIAVFERYGKDNAIGLGLVTGDTIQRGAVATSYAHDHHNILAVGQNPADLVRAVNAVIGSQGGYYAVEDGRVLAGIELPIGGILSGKDMESIGRELAAVTAALRHLGYRHVNPVMSLSTNSLPVSPLLKITDRGLIRFDQRKLVNLFVEEF